MFPANFVTLKENFIFCAVHIKKDAAKIFFLQILSKILYWVAMKFSLVSYVKLTDIRFIQPLVPATHHGPWSPWFDDVNNIFAELKQVNRFSFLSPLRIHKFQNKALNVNGKIHFLSSLITCDPFSVSFYSFII